MNPKGYWCLQLHAHLPFVHHPESEDYLEEQWLFEAISETYIPIVPAPQYKSTISLLPSPKYSKMLWILFLCNQA